MSEEEDNELTLRFQQLNEAIGTASQRCHRRTVSRLSREGMRLAKRGRKLIDYLSFSFNLFNHFETLCDDFAEGTDVIVECIALLEDPSKAKEFESGFDERLYEYTRWWLLPSAYHSLATLAGCQQGDNSPGLHQCINEGLAVCRRLGSSKDKQLMFREFAVEVQEAADDLDMALHTARESYAFHSETGRKVASADDIATLLAMQGRLSESCEMILEGYAHCQQFHNPYMALLNYVPMAREIASLAGRTDVLELLPVQIEFDATTELPEDRVLRTPDPEEHVLFEFVRQQCLAMELACVHDYDAAIAILERWDKHLYGHKNLNRWFPIRCRWIALERLKGNMERVRALAKPAEVMAKRAHDWLTLHKLKRLLDPAIPANPYATVGDPDCGPFASSQSRSISASSSHASESAGKSPAQIDALEANDPSGATKSDAASPAEPVLPEHVAAMYAELEANEGDETAVHDIAMKAMDVAPDAMRGPEEAEHLLRIAGLLADPNALDHAMAWRQAVIGAFPTSAEVLSMGAIVGSQWQMRTVDDPPESLQDDALVAMFQRAMDMNIQSPKPFYRAGAYHFGKQNLSEAERCLARAFRLDRQHSMAARTLAKVYNYTDRPRDALHVLDMCLREGTDDPNVAWEAALQANTVGHYAAMLTYLDRFEALVDRQPWCDYYRALALQELSRPAEALDALERELALNPDADCGVMMQRASALAMLGDSESMRAALQRVLETPFGNMDSITKHGLIQLFRRLWRSVESALPSQDAMRQALEQKMLDGCIAPDEMFDAIRVSDPETTEQSLHYFQVYLKQPLGQDWANSAGCLPGEQDWSECITLWRVLARDEEHARALSLAWQAKSFRVAASVEFIEQGDQEYIDRPGIVGQGPRYMPDPMAEENG